MPLKTAPPLGPHPPAYEKLLARLAHSGWFCDGTVVCRTLRRKVAGKWVNKGPYYMWTAKREGKTVWRGHDSLHWNNAGGAARHGRFASSRLTP